MKLKAKAKHKMKQPLKLFHKILQDFPLSCTSYILCVVSNYFFITISPIYTSYVVVPQK